MEGENIIKFRMKSSLLEFEYEGAASFIGKNLLEFIQNVNEAHRDFSPIEIDKKSPSESPAKTGNPSSPNPKLSASTIAINIKAKTGPDLALASCVYLSLSEGKESFSRQEILDTMKTVVGVYNQTMSKNLSQTIETLVRNKKIQQLSSSNYSLSAITRSEMEMKLGS
jgi:hypothetical protein